MPKKGYGSLQQIELGPCESHIYIYESFVGLGGRSKGKMPKWHELCEREQL